MSRIDRFCISKGWEDHFVGVIQSALARGLSDHRPIKFFTEVVDWGPRPFRFENGRLLQNNFLDLVRVSWDQIEVHGFAGFKLIKKLQCLKGKIREWKSVSLGNVDGLRAKAMLDIEQWDALGEERDLTKEEREARGFRWAIYGTWRGWRRYLGGKNLGHLGSKRRIRTLNSFTVWQTLGDGLISLARFA